MQAVTRRSRKSEIKAERKRAAAVYRTPNRYQFGICPLTLCANARYNVRWSLYMLINSGVPECRRAALKDYLKCKREYRAAIADMQCNGTFNVPLK